jgi:pimeloyl-ACP methyl ester carboxylesterase
MQHTITPELLTLQVDITGQVDDLPGPASTAVSVYWPPADILHRLPSQTLFTLVHGAGYTRRYWDLIVPGYERDAYSCARYLARQGYIVISLDTLGMGESHCTLNGFELTTAMMAQAAVVTTRILKHRLSKGTLIPDFRASVGFSVLVGHSMGAHLSALAQSRYKAFDALILQGLGGGKIQIAGLDERTLQLLSVPDANGYINAPRQYVHPFFHGSFGPPAEVIAEDDKYDVPTPVSLRGYAEARLIH